MFDLKKIVSYLTARKRTSVPFPVGKASENTLPTANPYRGRMLLGAYMRALAEVCKRSTQAGTISITAIHAHFLSYFGISSEEVTRRQFGIEFHRWVRENQLPLRVTKPRGSAVHVEGIDLSTITAAFQS